VLAFGCATTSAEKYFAYAAPTIERVAESDSLVMRRHGFDTIHQPYNEMLAAAAERDDLEALVLLHQDLSIGDPHFVDRIRALLAADEHVAVIGAAGARNVSSLAWWEGDDPAGRVESPELVPGGTVVDHPRANREVEAIDGILIVLSAWAVRELRFDAAIGPFDGYDVDICFQARSLGGRVVVGDFRDVAHHARGSSSFNRERWKRGAIALSRKWDVGDGLHSRAWVS
jgi:hypothetical protein